MHATYFLIARFWGVLFVLMVMNVPNRIALGIVCCVYLTSDVLYLYQIHLTNVHEYYKGDILTHKDDATLALATSCKHEAFVVNKCIWF